MVHPGKAASVFPRELVSCIQYVGESIGMAVASPWALQTCLERLSGAWAEQLGPDEPVIFKGARAVWRESHPDSTGEGPLVDTLSRLMVRARADERKQRLRQEFVKRLKTLADNARGGSGRQAPGLPTSPARLNPYDVLGVGPDASSQDVRTAWKTRALEYHPDRVANLGKKLKEVAEEETRTINAAYEMIRRAR
ncbi:J domain-containing protein [Hyalangium gracile]|uniref:J domain-containing protein n=1 Tax=Hyalangium gracile TaxID=394092 RepID=UPI001CC9BD39|nr:J domain-containing protein [Hyalangium gracile]